MLLSVVLCMDDVTWLVQRCVVDCRGSKRHTGWKIPCIETWFPDLELQRWGQWRRQDLLRGGTKMEIMSWGTHGGLQGRMQQRLDDYNSFVTNAVLIERAMSCWHLHQLISQTTQYMDSWLADLLQSELKWNRWKSRGGTCPSAP